MAIQTLNQFSTLLCSLPVGKTATLPLSVYALFFPPGEPNRIKVRRAAAWM